MCANSTWLNCITQNDKPCADGVHVESEMTVKVTLGGHGMGGGDTPANNVYSNSSGSQTSSFPQHIL